jgi:PIN domain
MHSLMFANHMAESSFRTSELLARLLPTGQHTFPEAQRGALPVGKGKGGQTVTRFDNVATRGQAAVIVASDLTLIECERVLQRAIALGELNAAEAADRHGYLMAAASQWQILHLAGEVVERAQQPFPAEPIRTLDAVHLASALTAREKTWLRVIAQLEITDTIRDERNRP